MDEGFVFSSSCSPSSFKHVEIGSTRRHVNAYSVILFQQNLKLTFKVHASQNTVKVKMFNLNHG